MSNCTKSANDPMYHTAIRGAGMSNYIIPQLWQNISTNDRTFLTPSFEHTCAYSKSSDGTPGIFCTPTTKTVLQKQKTFMDSIKDMYPKRVHANCNNGTPGFSGNDVQFFLKNCDDPLFKDCTVVENYTYKPHIVGVF